MGDVSLNIYFDDWREVAGLSMPGQVARYLDGQLIRREHLADIRVRRGDDDACVVERPEEARPPVWSRAGTHWVLRRLAMGAGAVDDQTDVIRLEPLADGLFHVVGGSHHALLIEGERSLTLVDAPLHPARSDSLLQRMAERWPDKPLRAVVVTHHHSDHSGGIVPLLRAGASLVVGEQAHGYFREVIDRARDLEEPVLHPVADRLRLDADGRALDIVNIPNSHAAGMLAVRVEGAALTFVADLYSPGREAQNPLLARELYQGLRWFDLADGHLVGAHGTGTEPMGALASYVDGPALMGEPSATGKNARPDEASTAP